MLLIFFFHNIILRLIIIDFVFLASGDDSNCTTPKRKENMSGNMMYQQGMGGIMGPPCSPAHDEYSNPEPMAPAWPRGPPSHNPVFNSHIPPQNEHVYRPKVVFFLTCKELFKT